MSEQITINGYKYIFFKPSSDAEFESLLNLERDVHGEGAVKLCRAIDKGLPGMMRANWYALIDGKGVPGTSPVLSALCLMPGFWTFGHGKNAIRIPVAELGLVATAEQERGKGLCPWLMNRYHDEALTGGFLVSAIEGIPYYYRRFGYEYALPLCMQLRLGPALSPWKDEYGARAAADLPGRLAESVFQASGLPPCKKAGPQEAHALARLFDMENRRLGIRMDRDAAHWDYLLDCAQASSDTAVERWIIEGSDGEAAAYFGTQPDGFGPGFSIMEAAGSGVQPAIILSIADAMRAQLGRPHLTIELPRSHPVSIEARQRGAAYRAEYGWQVRVLNPAGFASALIPILTERLAASRFGEKPYALSASLYGTGLDIAWDGKAIRIIANGNTDSDADHTSDDSLKKPCGSIRIPPDLLAPLMLGYRSIAELRRLRHDLSAYGEAEEFFTAMFPLTDGFIYPWF